MMVMWPQWRTGGGGGGEVGESPSPRKSEVLTKLSRIPSSVENTSVNNLIRIRVSSIAILYIIHCHRVKTQLQIMMMMIIIIIILLFAN
jgi:hypothetical protein